MRIVFLIFLQLFLLHLIKAEIVYTNNSNLLLRNIYNNIDSNTLNIQNFSNVDKNITEIAFLSKDEVNIRNKYLFISQLRLLNVNLVNNNNNYKNEQQIYLDELYSNIIFQNLSVNIGRKKINSGVSFFYPLTDVLSTNKRSDIVYNDKNIENSGQDLLSLDYLSDNSSIVFAYIPYFQDTSLNFTSTNNYDKSIKNNFFSKFAYSFNEQSFDLSLIYFNKNKRNIYAITATKNILDNIILYSEAKISKDSDSNFYKHNNTNTNFTIGANYTNTYNINFIAEYYYNDNGYNKKQWNTLIDDVKNMPVDFYPSMMDNFYSLEYLRKHYISLRLSNINIKNFYFYSIVSINLDDYGFKFTVGLDKEFSSKLQVSTEFSLINKSYSKEYNIIPYSSNILFSLKYFI